MKTTNIWEEVVNIPTYSIGKPEKNPMFIQKRVYQGSSGKVYPYPTIEKVSDTKEDLPYHVVFLENEYLKIAVLPELGGRIQRAYDKTNGYDFVYYNHVIKPALVGLTGPWISGGIEFNWPQHHRPSTYLPVDHITLENKDGSVSVVTSDVDRINGTKSLCRITLYPGKSYIEIKGQLYNRTSLPQTFLWWANPAVPVNENTQTIMPPDVTAVMDHGKRDVSRFPIATGVYYKHDYSEGVDISRYKNIPVPTSFMAASSHYDFVGGYDNGVNAGILHVADHHISPGKKQWTWGCGDFGKAWDRNLTDEDGPYVELMTGVYTDNQPDFSWLKPFEEKVFTQYFMPYKNVGVVKNATKEACIGMTVSNNSVQVKVYATSVLEGAMVKVTQGNTVILEEKVTISPEKTYEGSASFACMPASESEFSVSVMCCGKQLVSYRPEKEAITEIPSPAKPAMEPEKIMTNEELLFTGRHIEQYRHATYLPDPYYLEGLKRDPEDAAINCAYGMLMLRRGCIKKAEDCFRAAIKRLTEHNPNPYDSEAYYDLGLCLYTQGREDEAYDEFYKATWSADQQDMAFYYLACIEMKRGIFEEALQFIELSLVRNSHNIRARGLRTVVLRKLGKTDEAIAYSRESLTIDPFDYVTCNEAIELKSDIIAEEELERRSRRDSFNLLRAARDYAAMGCFEEAIHVLSRETGTDPMIAYYRSYYYGILGMNSESIMALNDAESRDSYCCFPNDLEDIEVLRSAINRKPESARAPYYLGNLYYDRMQWDEARELWKKSATNDPAFPTVFRNLALLYYNKDKNAAAASEMMEMAWSLDKTDARVFFELDQLHKKTGYDYERRLTLYEEYQDLFVTRDDLCIEYVTILNATGKYDRAYDFLMHHHFHPWEGGEGKVTTQYELCLLQLGRKALKAGQQLSAKEYLTKALEYPENLGEGKLEGTKDNHIYYYLGITEEMLGNTERAKKYFEMAENGTDEPAGVMYYNDQPADMILFQGLAFMKMGHVADANRRFYRLIDYGERHINDHVKIGYFAVSLPDFLTFEDDLDSRNAAHCNFLMAMGYAGIGDKKKATSFMKEALKLDQANSRIKLINNILVEEGKVNE